MAELGAFVVAEGAPERAVTGLGRELEIDLRERFQEGFEPRRIGMKNSAVEVVDPGAEAVGLHHRRLFLVVVVVHRSG